MTQSPNAYANETALVLGDLHLPAPARVLRRGLSWLGSRVRALLGGFAVVCDESLVPWSELPASERCGWTKGAPGPTKHL